jgi:hypothetical protein
MNEVDISGQELIEPKFNDGMRLPAADLHDIPWARGYAMDLIHHCPGLPDRIRAYFTSCH